MQVNNINTVQNESSLQNIGWYIIAILLLLLLINHLLEPIRFGTWVPIEKSFLLMTICSLVGIPLWIIISIRRKLDIRVHIFIDIFWLVAAIYKISSSIYLYGISSHLIDIQGVEYPISIKSDLIIIQGIEYVRPSESDYYFSFGFVITGILFLMLNLSRIKGKYKSVVR